ncbi:MAG TPA: hypothetical protein VEX35_01335 [Allosphingosinicella sp.]|nr:hypothetical protein [Allosphingosinicella sp.]
MIFAAAILLFFVPPLWMLSKGWPVMAGLTMLLAVMLPIVAMLAEYDDLPPGAGIVIFAAMPFALVALLTIAGGMVAAVGRMARRRASARGL